MKIHKLSVLLITLWLCGITHVSFAQELYPFDSMTQQQQFNKLLNELRCVTCQNQSLADSNALIAKDLRQIVYEQTKANKSVDEIKHYLVERYGNFILYDPPVNQQTGIIWALPLIVLVLALLLLMRYIQSLKNHSGQNDDR